MRSLREKLYECYVWGAILSPFIFVVLRLLGVFRFERDWLVFIALFLGSVHIFVSVMKDN